MQPSTSAGGNVFTARFRQVMKIRCFPEATCQVIAVRISLDNATFPFWALKYVAGCIPFSQALVLQLDSLDVVDDADAFTLLCLNLLGEEKLRLNVRGLDLALHAQRRIAYALRVKLENLRVVLPNGELLESIHHANPFPTIADITELCGSHVSTVRNSKRTTLFQVVFINEQAVKTCSNMLAMECYTVLISITFSPVLIDLNSDITE